MPTKSTLSRLALSARARKIRCLLLDVDGVMTDGKVHFTSDGQEFKSFDIQDGHGIVLAQRAGLLVGFISGRPSQATTRRAADLGVKIVMQSAVNKMEMVETVKTEHKLRDEEICFVGDELVDLPVLRRAGLAVAVPNATPEVMAVAHYVTKRRGGDGAVREVIEMILKANGSWQKAIARYLTLFLAGLALATTTVARDTTNPPGSIATGFIEKFEVPERDERGQLRWKLSGDKAVFRSNGLMDIVNAKAEFYSSNKVSLVFTAPMLVLDRANARAATDAPIRVERENILVTGIGGDWVGSNTTLSIRSNVQMIITGTPILPAPGTRP